MVGGVVHAYVKRFYIGDLNRGILTASGLVTGDACTGVIIALLAILGIVPASKAGYFNDFISIGIYGVMAALLGYFACRSKD